MHGIRGLQKAARDSRARPNDGIPGDAYLLGDLIRGLETDTGDVIGERVGVGAHGLNRLVSVGLEDANCAAGADAVRMQENHDLPNRFLFLPGFLNASPAFLPIPSISSNRTEKSLMIVKISSPHRSTIFLA